MEPVKNTGMEGKSSYLVQDSGLKEAFLPIQSNLLYIEIERRLTYNHFQPLIELKLKIAELECKQSFILI